MSVKTERPYVRTAQDLERKYALVLNSGNAIKQTENGLINVNAILNEFIAATIGNLETLQNQLDGKIDTWYGNGTPTLLNEPTSSWDAGDYDDHLGDIYYDNSTGNTYQFSVDNGTYSWEQIDSSLMSEIFGLANAAKDTADGKRQVFVTNNSTDTPTPPYDRGDIWIKNIGTTTGEVYICQIAKGESGTYTDGDFILGTKYTDDTTALSAQQVATLAQQKALNVEATADTLKFNFNNRFILADGTEEDDGRVVADNYATITFDDGAIIFSAENSKIQMSIDNDSIDFINKDDPTHKLASWSASEKQATSTELKLGNFAFQPRDNGSLGFRKVE